MNTVSRWLAPVLRNRMVLFILALALLVPLAFAPLSLRYPALGVGLLEGCGIVLLAMLVWKINWSAGREKFFEFVRFGVNTPILLFLAVAIASCMLSPHKAFSIQELFRLGSGIVLYFAVAYYVRRSDHLNCLVDVLLFLGAAMAVCGFVQFDNTTGKFATGLFGDHQLFGSALMALLPVAAAVAVAEKSSKRQILARAVTVLMAAGLLIAHSRSAWIGGAVALTVLALGSLALAVRKHGSHLRLHLAELIVPAALIVIALGFFLFMWPHSSTIVERGASFASVSQDSTWLGRMPEWRGAMKMVANKPLLGYGLGLYPYLQSHFTGVGNPVDTYNLRPSLADQAHNLYLQTAAEVGIPGLLLFLAVPIVFLITGVRRIVHMDDGIRKRLLMGVMAAIIGIMVDAFASPSWQLGQVALFLWLLLGVGASCMQTRTKRRAGDVPINTGPIYARWSGATASLGLLALLPLAALAAGPII